MKRTRRKDAVEIAIEETKQIQENIEMLAKAQDKAFFVSHSIVLSSSDSSDSDATSDRDSDENLSEDSVSIDYATVPLKEIVERSKSKLFQVAEEIEALMQKRDELDILFQQVLSLPEACFDPYLVPSILSSSSCYGC